MLGGGMLDDKRNIDDFFLTRAYNMVDYSWGDPIASWTESGKSFVIWNPIKFTGLVLFCQQFTYLLPLILSAYGFKRVGFERNEYANENFVRGHHLLLRNIPKPGLFISREESMMNQIGILLKEKEELLRKQELLIKELKYHHLQHKGICKL